MIRIIKSIHKEYFKNVSLDITTDFIDINYHDSDEVVVELIIESTMSDIYLNHLKTSGRYDVEFSVQDSKLLIEYSCNLMHSITLDSFSERVTCLIYLPKDIDYEFTEEHI